MKNKFKGPVDDIIETQKLINEAMKELRKEVPPFLKELEEINKKVKELAEEHNDYIHAFPLSHKTPEERAVSEKEKAEQKGRSSRAARERKSGTKSD
jgi:hypothetical protein